MYYYTPGIVASMAKGAKVGGADIDEKVIKPAVQAVDNNIVKPIQETVKGVQTALIDAVDNFEDYAKVGAVLICGVILVVLLKR
jgi:UDP-N-acetyl-D-mannosaminuronate dehydrogenase